MPGNISNEELVSKAAIVADDLASAGKLNPAQSDRFIDFVIDETVLKDNARIVRFRNESLEIDKIGVGRRAAVPKSEAVDPGIRRGISTSKITLTPSEIMVPFEIGDNFRELNIEGDSIEDTIVRLMATRLANDLEELYINGNKLGPAVLESDYLDNGDSTKYRVDSYLKLQDGWSLLADGANVKDAEGRNIGLSVFSDSILAMPTKFRRNRNNLRWYLSPDLWQIYMEKLSTRATALGDDAAKGGGGMPGPFGITAVPVPLWEFKPPITEHIVLSGTTAVALKNGPVESVVVTPSTLDATPVTPYVSATDYTLDATNGTVARIGGGAIGDGDTVKVTYRAYPQLMLTHMNNFIVGIGRDIRIEKDRDIYKGVNQYAITAKVAVQFEELTAIVKTKNIGINV
ncbi:MAG: hypothetical protein ACFFD1_00690 [Candidatus Thorarchaeota archaeon]